MLQDFLAPELRAITERINGMEKNLGEKLEPLERKMNRRFDYIEPSFRLDGRIEIGRERAQKASETGINS